MEYSSTPTTLGLPLDAEPLRESWGRSGEARIVVKCSSPPRTPPSLAPRFEGGERKGDWCRSTAGAAAERLSERPKRLFPPPPRAAPPRARPPAPPRGASGERVMWRNDLLNRVDDFPGAARGRQREEGGAREREVRDEGCA